MFQRHFIFYFIACFPLEDGNNPLDSAMGWKRKDILFYSTTKQTQKHNLKWGFKYSKTILLITKTKPIVSFNDIPDVCNVFSLTFYI